MVQGLLRFLIGGSVVSLFAVLGEVLRPRSFAGLFGAAPAVALATLALTIAHDGKTYAALEARSMVAGAVAFFVYALVVSYLLVRLRGSVVAVTVGAIPVWGVAVLGLWAAWLR